MQSDHLAFGSRPLSGPIKVAIAHGQPLVSLGLLEALRHHADIEVHRCLASEISEDVEVVVTDYEQALELSGRLGGEGASRSKILVVSYYDREQEVRIAIENGVQGYILLGCHTTELEVGVRALGRGAKYLCSDVAMRIAESLTRSVLTVRETDVLYLVAEGQCNKTIARQLNIGVGTVKSHMSALMEKLHATSRTEAAKIAMERGLLKARSLSGQSAPSPHRSHASRVAHGSRLAQAAH